MKGLGELQRGAKRITAGIVLAVWILPSTTFADALAVNAIPCVAPAMNSRVSASIPSNMKAPRIFFKAPGPGPEYYVDMRPGPNGTWSAILPAIALTTKSITYHVGAIDSTGHWVTSAPITLPASTACPTVALTPDEKLSAAHLVVGLTASNQSIVGSGFSCVGVTNEIAANGQMRNSDDCRAALLAEAKSAKSVKGFTITPQMAAAFAAGGLGVGYAIGHGGKNNRLVSPAR